MAAVAILNFKNLKLLIAALMECTVSAVAVALKSACNKKEAMFEARGAVAVRPVLGLCLHRLCNKHWIDVAAHTRLF